MVSKEMRVVIFTILKLKKVVSFNLQSSHQITKYLKFAWNLISNNLAHIVRGGAIRPLQWLLQANKELDRSYDIIASLLFTLLFARVNQRTGSSKHKFSTYPRTRQRFKNLYAPLRSVWCDTTHHYGVCDVTLRTITECVMWHYAPLRSVWCDTTHH